MGPGEGERRCVPPMEVRVGVCRNAETVFSLCVLQAGTGGPGGYSRTVSTQVGRWWTGCGTAWTSVLSGLIQQGCALGWDTRTYGN